ncbi:hypothetical protein MUK42_31738 [Musa troglodytarum]|uniref:MLO-like protein n=1 Tax=Musa troglodytarum TaxID=320322 RepID=A0A9E7JE22_9LILI|nr:hypothetical protein MUK42_31738 [Musa troglodytarum]
MAGGGGGGDSRELDQTPTWAVAAVCAVIVLISILLEKGLHHFGEDLENIYDPSRFRFAHETSFVRRHTSLWNRITILFYFVSFLKQFFNSVSKADYLALHHGFINAHLAPGSKFNFQKYIKRTLEDDFKAVVGISVCLSNDRSFMFEVKVSGSFIHVFLLWMSSPVLWASAVIVLLLNVHGWEELFWASILPLVIILAIGMKLQAIIARMAIEIQERHSVVQGIPLVQLSDRHFWFKNPQFALFLIHFALFQNAFQITYFFWIWYEFGLKSCFHDNFDFIIARVSVGVGVQFLCSYITLPLYALVSQMGSHMKRSIFDEQTSKALKKWHQAVKKKHEKGTSHASSVHETSPRASSPASPLRPMQRYRTIGHTRELSNSSTGNVLDHYNSDAEIEMLSLSIDNNQESRPTQHHLCIGEHRNNEDQFSFDKLSAQTGGQPQS